MNFPEAFTDQLQRNLGKNEADALSESLLLPAPTSIRINSKKMAGSVSLEPVPWSENGYYLNERPQFVDDPYWHGGAYYVQEASSMIIGHVVSQIKNIYDRPIRILDLCGAPGGKSTNIISQLEPDDLLVANEVIKSRAKILYENVVKWGYPNHLVTSNDPKDFESIPGFFDILVVDAPCSGEGLFRKDPGAISEWSIENVNLCSQRQERIIWDVWDCLSEGGYLIYSTCTFNRRENHEILHWVEENFNINNVAIQLDDRWKFLTSSVNQHQVFQAYPHLLKGEGFSFFVVQKTGSVIPKKIKARVNRITPAEVHLHSTRGDYVVNESDIYYMTHPEEISFLDKYLNLLRPGLHIGTYKKNKLVPSQELANSIVLDPGTFDTVQVDDFQAIKYLKNETFDITGEKGFYLVKFNDLPLGFINHLGNRFNNLFPQSWRIRKKEVIKAKRILT